MRDMNLLQMIAFACAVISGLLTLLFGVLGVMKLIQIWNVMEAAKQEAANPKPVHAPGMAVGKQSALVPEPDKILTAAAKLTDSLAKAPLAVVSIVMAVVFMILAIWAADLVKEAPPSKTPSKEIALRTVVPSNRCQVGGFASGDHLLPDMIHDDPTGCLNDIVNRLAGDQLGMLFIVGRCDIDEMQPKVRARYKENFFLAYQRGVALKTLLGKTMTKEAFDRFDQHSVVVVGSGEQRNHADLAKDRVVELIPYWMVESKVLASAESTKQ
jgi:hypothetical protein